MSDYELYQYLFDLQGYLVLEDVLTADEVSTLNRLLDEQDLPQPGETFSSGEFGMGGSASEVPGFLEWGKPLCDLLDHPRIMPVLRLILGDGFRIDHLYGVQMGRGTDGLQLHGGATPLYSPSEYYLVRDARIYSGLVAVSWNLTDTGPDHGGFLCVPGSHKSNFVIPDQVHKEHVESGCVVVPEVRAGSVVIFTEALTHGTAPWKAHHIRRSLLLKYNPAHQSSVRMQVTAPENVELTPRQRLLFLPPSNPGSMGRPSLFEPEYDSGR